MHLTKEVYEVRENLNFPAHSFYRLMIHGDCIVLLLYYIAYMLICQSLTVCI